MSREYFEEYTDEIYPGGDTLLLCGPKKVELLVHSIFLANVSTVFEAMLRPNSREGQTHGRPREIPLPEDDPSAMQIICNAAHSRSVPDDVSSDLLLAVCTAAEKYDVVSILKYTSAHWISSLLSRSPSIEHIWKAMTAAYLLKDSESFRQTTGKIIREYQEPFRDLEPLLGDQIPADIIPTLEEKRSQIRLELAHLSLYRPCCSPTSWMQVLEQSGLLPWRLCRVKPAAVTFQKIEEMRDGAGICLEAFQISVSVREQRSMED